MMSIRRWICLVFRPKRNVRKRKQWLSEYMLELNYSTRPLPNRERK